MTLGNVKKRNSGKIMIEFLLVAPVFLMISGGTIEVANFMRLSQVSTVVSQEAANQAYRQCSSVVRLTNPNDRLYNSNGARMQIDNTTTQAAVQNCLENVRANSLVTLNKLNPSTTINAVHLMAARVDPIRPPTDMSRYQTFEANTAPGVSGSGTPPRGDDAERHGQTGGYSSPENDREQAPTRRATCNNGVITYPTNSGSIPLIPKQELDRRQQVIVGQAVAGYTPLVKFFNLKILYSGDFRAVTVM